MKLYTPRFVVALFLLSNCQRAGTLNFLRLSFFPTGFHRRCNLQLLPPWHFAPQRSNKLITQIFPLCHSLEYRVHWVVWYGPIVRSIHHLILVSPRSSKQYSNRKGGRLRLCFVLSYTGRKIRHHKMEEKKVPIFCSEKTAKAPVFIFFGGGETIELDSPSEILFHREARIKSLSLISNKRQSHQ